MVVSINFVQSQNVLFHLNSLGYLPEAQKIATISTEFETFQVINSDNNQIVFDGKSSGPFFQADVNMKVWKADFSDLKTAGSYFLKLDIKQNSPTFKIASDIFNDAFVTSMRAFYLWRCGTAVEADYNGDHFSHKTCHINDGWLDSIGMPDQQKDGTGGWHDAGDHGKYVVNAGITVGMLFMAWDQYYEKLFDCSLNLPETAPGYPDYLKELKWETDWILKMAYPDGSGRVSHKLTRTNFSGFIMPEDDHEKRYFTDWSSAATAGYVAMLAQAARFFEPYDSIYAKTCLDAALRSYEFLKNNPEYKKFTQKFNTGAYYSPDEDDRMWAAVELWETTGNYEYLNDFEKRISTMEVKIDENWDWPNVKNLAAFTYLLSKREDKNIDLLLEVEKQTVEVANKIVDKAEKDIFKRPLDEYYWGCNGTIVRQVMNLQMAYKIDPNIKYKQTALNAINNIFGHNQYGRSFVTGLGFMPPMQPHDRRSGADNVHAPWPGYIIGGGETASNWIDDWKSYSTNEVAINWQAALVYALVVFIE